MKYKGYMLVKRIVSLLFFAVPCISYAQDIDTLLKIDEVTINAYLGEQKLIKVPTSVSILSSKQLERSSKYSMVNLVNTAPGVRMEERTPGSYRLSIRGSLLRSPFGVRNIKVYYNDVPLTDAGGNTYLNAIDPSVLNKITILKGPDGSLFGANSGGVVLLNSGLLPTSKISANINLGGFGALNQNLGLRKDYKNHSFTLQQSFQEFKGYREHSSMFRRFFQFSDNITYGSNNSMKIFGFYSHLNYKTPGGLTFSQFKSNPRLSRPATATLPSAIEQDIGIDNKMLLGGLVNEVFISKSLKNVTSIFGGQVNFKNPFITNYEQRLERNLGGRSYFQWFSKDERNWRLNLGMEVQTTSAAIKNFDNVKGKKGNPQTFDQVNSTQSFVFLRYESQITKRLNVEAGVSLNFYKFKFLNQFPLQQNDFNNRSFNAQWMPKLGLNYELSEGLNWRSSVSRGYSTPTIAEIRPSDNRINTSLQPEVGINYESGFRYNSASGVLNLDVSYYVFKLQKSIVNRRLPNETDYFINSGGTDQQGVEGSLSLKVLKFRKDRLINELLVNQSITYNLFTFRDYAVNGINYSGNQLTGTPVWNIVNSMEIGFLNNAFLYLQHQFTDRIPLNDANFDWAPNYHLMQAKLGYSWNRRDYKLQLFMGGDNLFNKTYSLGNDLNAIGNRFYNPAPARNFSFGLNFNL